MILLPYTHAMAHVLARLLAALMVAAALVGENGWALFGPTQGLAWARADVTLPASRFGTM